MNLGHRLAQRASDAPVSRKSEISADQVIVVTFLFHKDEIVGHQLSELFECFASIADRKIFFRKPIPRQKIDQRIAVAPKNLRVRFRQLGKHHPELLANGVQNISAMTFLNGNDPIAVSRNEALLELENGLGLAVEAKLLDRRHDCRVFLRRGPLGKTSFVTEKIHVGRQNGLIKRTCAGRLGKALL
jgi:hypothetical protein